eukprot:3413348-Amphidinium_carterae.1
MDTVALGCITLSKRACTDVVLRSCHAPSTTWDLLRATVKAAVAAQDYPRNMRRAPCQRSSTQTAVS